MVSTPQRQANEPIARQIVKEGLSGIGLLLEIIGEPLYFILVILSDSLNFLLDIIGYLINLLRWILIKAAGHLLDIQKNQERLKALFIIKKTDWNSVLINKNKFSLSFLEYLPIFGWRIIHRILSTLKMLGFISSQEITRKRRKLSLILKVFQKTVNHILFPEPVKPVPKKVKRKTGQPRRPIFALSLTLPKFSLPQFKISSLFPAKLDLISYQSLINFLKALHLLKSDITEMFLTLGYALVAFKRFLTAKLTLLILGGLLTILGFSVFAFWFFIYRELPPARQLSTRDLEVSTKIYDRNGILLYKIFEDHNRSPVSLKDIPMNVKLATLAIEDAGFYSHPGFSIRGISRAGFKLIQKGEVTGGSTITQQLVKNALLSNEKTFIRKLKELTLAVEVERVYSKDQILEMYLNEVSYGGTAYGIQEAARMYFNKDVKNLSLAEAALLAGLLKSPSQFTPFGSHPEMSKERQLQVLHLMQNNGFITEEQRLIAEKEQLTYAPNTINIKAPHFVMYVRDQLEEKYGKEIVEKGGLEVVTTLDYRIQQLAEKAVKEEVDKLSKLNVTNGAAVVLNPATGEILAMVGSKDYFDTKADGNVNVATALRQPGSSIKLVNYTYALAHGYTPASILDDTPVTFAIPGQQPYQPKNYDGRYRGKITLRSAFAESRNIPAVRVLESYGVKNMIDMGKKMGITTWNDSSRFGLSLTLGGGAVKLVDLANVYATIANYGKRPELTSVLEIKNYKGESIEKYACDTPDHTPLVAQLNTVATDVSATSSAIIDEAFPVCQGIQAVDPRVAFMVTSILSDNDARSPAFGRNSQLVIPGHPNVAVKTGTSNELRDNLTIGYTQKYVVAVWVGNNNNSPMSRVASGVTGASPIFNKIMTGLLADEADQPWQTPGGLTQLPVCMVTGTLSCEGCPTKNEWFLNENQPTNHCSVDFIDELRKKMEEQWKNGNGNNGNGNGNNDHQFRFWWGD